MVLESKEGTTLSIELTLLLMGLSLCWFRVASRLLHLVIKRLFPISVGVPGRRKLQSQSIPP